ncbi:MAG: HNH endonuclease [Hyphomicrobiaceae bacterium]
MKTPAGKYTPAGFAFLDFMGSSADGGLSSGQAGCIPQDNLPPWPGEKPRGSPVSYAKTYVVEHAAELVVCFDVRPEGEGLASFSVVGTSDRRTIDLERVQQVSDFETGEVLAHIDQAFGGPPSLSDDDIKAIRGRDKSLWDKLYRAPVIENHYRNKLFALFEHRCFKCRRPGRLETYQGMEHVPFWRGLDRDHHVPISLGGHLVPGNIVVLCTSCNSRKHERDPRVFYTAEQLEALRPLLAKEPEVLAFAFDWERWQEDRREYLMSLGVAGELVEQVLNNEDHRYFVGKGGFDLSEALVKFTSEEREE